MKGKKRKRSEDKVSTHRSPRARAARTVRLSRLVSLQDKSVVFGSVNIREYEIEVFGGGGVPTEGGPALGLR